MSLLSLDIHRSWQCHAIDHADHPESPPTAIVPVRLSSSVACQRANSALLKRSGICRKKEHNYPRSARLCTNTAIVRAYKPECGEAKAVLVMVVSCLLDFSRPRKACCKQCQ